MSNNSYNARVTLTEIDENLSFLKVSAFTENGEKRGFAMKVPNSIASEVESTIGQ